MDAAPHTTLCALLTETQAADALSVSVRTLQAWRTRGTGPSFVKAGRSVRYARAALVSWTRRNTVAARDDDPEPGRFSEAS